MRAGLEAGRRRRHVATAAAAALGVVASILVVAPPAQAVTSSDVAVAFEYLGPLTIGSPTTVYLDVSTYGPDAPGPVTVVVSATGAAATLAGQANPGDGAGSSCSKVGAAVQCAVPGLDPATGVSWTSLPIALTPTGVGTLTLSASATPTAADPVAGNNAATTQATVVDPTASDVSVSVSDLGNPTRYQALELYLSVATAGPLSSGPVSVHLVGSGAGATLELGEFYDDGRGTTCTVAAATLDCSVPSLDPGGGYGPSASIPVTVRLGAAGPLTISATATGTTRDADTSNNAASAQVTVVDAPSAGLSLTAAPDPEGTCQYVWPSPSEYGGIAASGVLSAPGGVVDGVAIEVTAVPDDGSPTLTEEATTDSSGAWSVVLCGGRTTSYTVTATHVPTSTAGAATTTVRVAPRATSATARPSTTQAVYGRSITVTIVVRDAVTKVAHHEIDAVAVLQRRAPGAATWVSAAVSSRGVDAASAWEVELALNATTELRVHYPGQGPGSAGSDSVPVLVVVRGAVSMSASPRTVTPGGIVTVTGAVSPTVGPLPVLQRLAAGRWSTVVAAATRSGSRATWSLRPAAGTSSYRVFWPGTTTVASGGSGALPLSATLVGRGSRKAYSFIGGTPRNPARWNPCRVIRYSVNTTYAAPGAVADVQETFRRIAQYTGMRFSYAGLTRYMPGRSGGAAPAPIVIAWATPRQAPDFGNPYLAGFASPSWYLGGRAPRIFSSPVLLNATLKIPAGFGRGFTRGQLLMHELGHAMGLGHVNDPWQVMIPSGSTPGDSMYGAGDAAGLRLLGRSRGCL